MANIEGAKKEVMEFLKKTLNVKDVTVIKVTKTGEGWESEAEVFEASSFIKSLGLSTKVQDRNIYVVKLNGGRVPTYLNFILLSYLSESA